MWLIKIPLTIVPLRPAASSLPEDYYLKNFRCVLTFVESRYQDLLTDNEKGYIDAFQFLDENAQRLYARLMLRKGPLFRSDKLNYS